MVPLVEIMRTRRPLMKTYPLESARTSLAASATERPFLPPLADERADPDSLAFGGVGVSAALCLVPLSVGLAVFPFDFDSAATAGFAAGFAAGFEPGFEFEGGGAFGLPLSLSLADAGLAAPLAPAVFIAGLDPARDGF